jgi:hypothetical protein
MDSLYSQNIDSKLLSSSTFQQYQCFEDKMVGANGLEPNRDQG